MTKLRSTLLNSSTGAPHQSLHVGAGEIATFLKKQLFVNDHTDPHPDLRMIKLIMVRCNLV